MTDPEVILSFTDRSLRKCTAAEAEKICRDPKIRGRIIDALTDDHDLQSYLRKLIDQE